MGRDRKDMIRAPWWMQQSQYGDGAYAASTGIVMAGTAVIALPHGDISSIATGIGIFGGRIGSASVRIQRCRHVRLGRRRRVCA